MRRFCDHYQVDPRVSVEVRESIPQHVGLGSGTQLALAIGLGMATVCGIDADVWDVAAAMGRGRRSGVGTAAFQAGGFVVDAGHKKGRAGREAAPTVVWRRDFPADWRFVVVVPDAVRGLSGRSEEGVFGALAPSVRISEEVCRITQLRLMPALVEHDIEEFGRALTAVDRKTGAYFSRRARRCLQRRRDDGGHRCAAAAPAPTGRDRAPGGRPSTASCTSGTWGRSTWRSGSPWPATAQERRSS